jgi:hypothetical protein
MAYYLGKERDKDIVGSYRRYQQYLHENQAKLAPGAFALGTAEWYQNPRDHRCPHDGWLESLLVSEHPAGAPNGRVVAISIRLLGPYHDGYIEFSYPKVFAYTLETPSSGSGLGDWRYDEFRLSSGGHVIHEIEWSGFPGRQAARWIIEASEVKFQWIPQSGSRSNSCEYDSASSKTQL